MNTHERKEEERPCERRRETSPNGFMRKNIPPPPPSVVHAWKYANFASVYYKISSHKSLQRVVRLFFAVFTCIKFAFPFCRVVRALENEERAGLTPD